jgi:hypothetical protein
LEGRYKKGAALGNAFVATTSAPAGPVVFRIGNIAPQPGRFSAL